MVFNTNNLVICKDDVEFWFISITMWQKDIYICCLSKYSFRIEKRQWPTLRDRLRLSYKPHFIPRNIDPELIFNQIYVLESQNI